MKNGEAMTATRYAAAVFAHLALSASAHAYSNYAECILERVPNTKNPTSFGAVMRQCAERYPDLYFGVEKGGGIGMFGPKTPDACIVKYAEETTFAPAAGAVAGACQCLYGRPAFKDDRCAHIAEMFRR